MPPVVSTGHSAGRCLKNSTAAARGISLPDLEEAVFEIYPLAKGQTTDTSTRLGFSVPDPDEAVSNVEDIGGRVVKQPFESAWGYMAIVTDPDGRTVELHRD